MHTTGDNVVCDSGGGGDDGGSSIQFNSKTLFKDGDPVSLQLIFPGAIQTCKQIQQLFIHVYKTTQVHRTNTGTHSVHFLTKTYP